ncbi:LysR family transcriptional regulator [Litorivicinus sp.]|nr:LysR family transcriptional regulator [Litorivicinus sp.]
MTGLLMKTIPGLKLKLILPDNATLLGRGKIELLKAIAKEHSLSQAAKSLGMSYRRAWLLIRELNDSMKTPVLITQTGGQSGGGSELTEAATRLIELYEKLAADAELATKATREQVAYLLKSN